MDVPLIVAGFIVLMWISACLHVLREYERAVVFRLGRLQTPDKGPGLIFIFWPIDKLVRVSLRIIAWDVPPQDTITR
ncbi:MAG: SPFH domain-containing protein, partial [Terriglobia bacterium]